MKVSAKVFQSTGESLSRPLPLGPMQHSDRGSRTALALLCGVLVLLVVPADLAAPAQLQSTTRPSPPLSPTLQPEFKGPSSTQTSSIVSSATSSNCSGTTFQTTPCRKGLERPVGPASFRPQWVTSNAGSGSVAPPWGATEMTYDGYDGYLVAHGGCNVPNCTRAGNATWVFYGGAWHNVTIPSDAGPECPGWHTGSIAFDPPEHYVLYYGCGQTWTFRSGSWTQLNLTLEPSYRYDAAMTFDPADGSVLLFGGEYFLPMNASVYNDTWAFRDGNWSRIHTAVAPFPRAGAAMTFDPDLDRVVLFGGEWFTRTFSDTWTYSAGNWTNVTTSVGASPPPRGMGALADDPVDHELVLYGGLEEVTSGGYYSYYGLGDTWVLANGTWKEVSSSSTPPPIVGAALAFLPSNGSGRMVMTGGGYFDWYGDLIYGYNATWFFPDAPLRAYIGVTHRILDIGENFTVVASFSGGAPPYSCIWNFGDGTIAPTFTAGHSYSRVGSFTLTLNVTDARGEFAEASISLLASSPSPLVEAAAQPTAADVGQNVTFRASTVGGSGGSSFAWSGLPAGCTTLPVPTLNCTPSAVGLWIVKVTATDSNGNSVTSSGLAYVVDSAPTLTPLVADPPTVVVGQSLNLTISVTGGMSPYSFTWVGLPSGCTSSSTRELQCVPDTTGSWNVTVEVTDSNGIHRTSGPVTIAARLAVVGGTGHAGGDAGLTTNYLILIAAAGLVVAGALLLARRGRRKGMAARPHE